MTVIRIWAFLSLLLLPAIAAAQEEAPLRNGVDDKGIFTFSLENDLFAGTDNGYTNGIRVSWLSAETDVPKWLEDVADWANPFFAYNGYKRYSFEFGQSMFAPDDLTQTALIRDDRPYAGWLYGSAGLLSDTGRRLDNFQITLGMVGPSALAEPSQKFVHEIVGSTDPQGWDNQLRNEPGLILTYERKWRGIYEFSPFGLAVDVTPHLGGSVGNIFTHASAGAIFRLGLDLPADYGPPLIRPSVTGSDFFIPTKHVGWYLFTGFEGRAVARNIFLDGNTFTDSHSVDKEHYVGGIQAGVAFTYGDARLAYTHVVRSHEFKEQDGNENFGAVTLSYRF